MRYRFLIHVKIQYKYMLQYKCILPETAGFQCKAHKTM